MQKPANLAIVVFDNGLYGETGMQESHTSGGVDLLEVARGCGIDMPITREIYRVLYENKDPRAAVGDLMLRSPKQER